MDYKTMTYAQLRALADAGDWRAEYEIRYRLYKNEE